MREDEKGLRIDEPCPKKWAELEGEGARRFCGQCSLHVVDGASLTRREAEALVRSAGERVCMRILRDAEGRAVHREEVGRSKAMGSLLRFGLTAAAGAMAACGDDRDMGSVPPTDTGTHSTDPVPGTDPERPPEIMGEVCFPEEPVEEEIGKLKEGATRGEEIVGRIAYEELGDVAVAPEDDGPQD